MGAAVERAVVEGEGEAAGLEDGGSVGVGAAVLAHRRSPASYESLQTGQLDVIAMILLRLLYVIWSMRLFIVKCLRPSFWSVIALSPLLFCFATTLDVKKFQERFFTNDLELSP